MNKTKVMIFWIASLTWGIPLTLAGAVVAIVLIILGNKAHLYKGLICFEIGNGWGGFSCGAFIFVNKNPSLRVLSHECGHGVQNTLLGVMMPFIICIPSALRYWYRYFVVITRRKMLNDLPAYDSIWFESWATKIGEKYFLAK